jgi:hypothetical protein
MMVVGICVILEQTKSSQPDSVSLTTNLLHPNMEPSGKHRNVSVRNSLTTFDIANDSSLRLRTRSSAYFTGENSTFSEVYRRGVCTSVDRSSSMASMFELLPEIQPMMMFEERGTELSQRRSSAELVSIIPRMSA